MGVNKQTGGKENIIVAVVLINYNSLLYTNECILSLSQSSIKPFIVVIDNASNNGDKISDELISYNFGFHFIGLSGNIGFGKANNVAIKWLQNNYNADYILLLNNDTIVQPETIEKLIEPFSRDNTIGITTCKIMFSHNPDLVWYGGGELNFKRGKQRIVDFNKKATLEGANKSRYVTFASGCAMMFTSASLLKIGGFDEKFFMYVEDLELCIRAQKLFYKIWYSADTFIIHKVYGSSNKTNINLPGMHPDNPNLSFYTYHMVKNMLLTMHKHLNKVRWFDFFVYYSSIMMYKNLTYLIRGRFDGIKAYIKANIDFIKEKD